MAGGDSLNRTPTRLRKSGECGFSVVALWDRIGIALQTFAHQHGMQQLLHSMPDTIQPRADFALSSSVYS